MREKNLSFEPNLLTAVQQKLDLSIERVVVLSRTLCFIMHKTRVINRQLVDIKLFIIQLCDIMMVNIQEFGFFETETWRVRMIYNI